MDEFYDSAPTRKAWPLPVSVSIIVAAVLLSFVDLIFLNDVIGQVLDLSTPVSMVLSCFLGLIGIAIMALHGLKVGHGNRNRGSSVLHFTLWILLGLAFFSIRMFSATIMKLDSFNGSSLIAVGGSSIREVDLVLAPMMFLLYLATGLMVLEGVKNLCRNPRFAEWLDNHAKLKAERKATKEKKKEAARQRKLEAKAKKMALREKRMQQKKAKKAKKLARREYTKALKKFRNKEKQLKNTYDEITKNISFIKSMDKQQKEFETKMIPGLENIVIASLHSTQNSVALAIRKLSGDDISNLREVIERHNNGQRGVKALPALPVRKVALKKAIESKIENTEPQLKQQPDAIRLVQ